MKRGRLFLGVVATAAALAAAGVAATALTTKSDRTTIAPDQKGVAVAKCPRGSEAASGGFNSPGFESGANGIYTYASKRAGTRKVKALGAQTGMAESGLVAYAYCDGTEPGLITRTAKAPAEDGEDTSVSTRCPRGSEAVWGGFASPGVPADDLPILTLGSRREGQRKWTVTGVSFAFGPDDLILKAFVYCDPSEPGLVVRKKSAILGNNETGSAAAKCRRGFEAVSGGYLAPAGFDTSTGSEIYFRESRRLGDRRWKASGEHQNPQDARLVAIAYCEKT